MCSMSDASAPATERQSDYARSLLSEILRHGVFGMARSDARNATNHEIYLSGGSVDEWISAAEFIETWTTTVLAGIGTAPSMEIQDPMMSDLTAIWARKVWLSTDYSNRADALVGLDATGIVVDEMAESWQEFGRLMHATWTRSLTKAEASTVINMLK